VLSAKTAVSAHLEVFRKKVFWGGEYQFQILINDITERKRAGRSAEGKRRTFPSVGGEYP